MCKYTMMWSAVGGEEIQVSCTKQVFGVSGKPYTPRLWSTRHRSGSVAKIKLLRWVKACFDELTNVFTSNNGHIFPFILDGNTGQIDILTFQADLDC